jgi:hypothetical protein
LAATGYYFYNKYLANNRWKPLLQARLQELVVRSSDSLYHIEYSGFDLNITAANATLYNFRLVPDINVYNKLVALNKAPDNLFILSVKKLSIKKIGARKAYKEKILDVDNILIESPNLTVINKRYGFNDTVKIGKSKTPYQLLKNIFKQVKINSVSLKDISLNYINKNDPVTKHTAIKHLGIDISDINIDSLADKDPDRFYYTRDVSVTVNDYHIGTPDGLYKASLKKIFFSTAQRKIVLDKIAFLPLYNRVDFYRETGKPGDIYSLKIKRITINDVDLQKFLRQQRLYAGTMDIINPNIEIYANNAFKGKKTIKIGKDPQQELQKAVLDMRLKRLDIKNGKIDYAETNAITGATGEMLFTHTNGYILNLTNDAEAKRTNPYMSAFIKTSFMDAAPLQVNFKFNLKAADGAFNYSGELGKFDGKVFDKLVKPLAMVHVESADVDKLTFNVNASNYSGKGNLEFYYKNLKIQFLKKVAGKTELQKQGFISMLANQLILESNNPDKKGVFRPGPVDLKRDPTTSFFSFLYKGLLDGLKPSVGYDKKTETQVNTTIIKVSNLVDKLKKIEEDRKQRREKRRNARKAKRDSIAKSKLNDEN